MKRSLADDIAGVVIGAVLIAGFLVPLFLMGITRVPQGVVEFLDAPEIPGGLLGRWMLLLAIPLFTLVAGTLFVVRSIPGIRDAVRNRRKTRR